MNHSWKRFLCLALAFMLVASLLPTGIVSAEDIVYTDVADEAALLAAIEAGNNPKLTASFTLSADITVAADAAITLDLNGQTLTTYSSVTDAEGTVTYTKYQITVSGTLTVLDSSEAQTGTIAAIPAGASTHAILVSSGATLHLQSGTIDMAGDSSKTGAAYAISNKGTITVDAATINATSYNSNAFPIYMTAGSLTVNEGANLTALSSAASNSAAGIYCTGGTVTITGGTIYAKNTNTSTSYGVQLAGSGTPILNISGGNITAEHAGYRDARALDATRGTITISGGTFTCNTTGAAKKVGTTQHYNAASAVYIRSSADAVITNGTFNATAAGGRCYAVIVDGSSASLDFKGGTITANTQGSYAGYGLMCSNNGTLTLRGGTVTSTGVKAATYGISVAGTNAFTMTGGTVTADTTASTTSITAYGLYVNAGSTANLKGGTITAGSASGNAYGIQAIATLTTDVSGEEPVISGATRATVNFPADSAEMTVTATAATGSAYGVSADGAIINANSSKLTATANTGYAATSGSTMKYAYGLNVQGQATVTAGKFNAYATTDAATKVQAFGLNNSRKSVTATLADSSTVTLYEYSTVTVSGGSFHGSSNKGTGAGIMTNYSDGLTITGDAVVTGTDHALWAYNGTVNVTGGTFSTDGTYPIRVGDGATGFAANVTISGGTVKHSGQNPVRVTGTKGASLSITGGKFVGDVGRGSVDVLALLPDGYTQDYYGEVVADTPTAKYEVTANGTTAQYTSYWEAMAAVNTDTAGNGTFKLLSDIYLGAATDFTSSVNVDLNGKTWVQSNGTAINVTAVGTENAITQVKNGTVINDNAAVPIYIRAGAIQLDGVTAYGHTTMPVCYTTSTGDYAADNYVKNSNLITSRFYTFSYRTLTAQTDMNVLFENTNLINLYTKANGGEFFFTGWSETTGQYTIGEGVNMYAAYASSTLQRQNSSTTDSKGNPTIGTAGTETVTAVAADGCTIHTREDAASYADINAILADLNSKASIDINASPSLYKWSTEHTYAGGACSCGDTSVASIGDTTYTDLGAALYAATEGQTVTVNGNITADADYLVGESITLDLNGKDLNASSLTVYGNLVDGATGGDALVSSDNFHIAGTSYLPVYDASADGYRFYKYTINELGSKTPDENTVKFGYRLNLDNSAGYRLLQDDTSKVSITAVISWTGDGSGSMTYSFKAATLASFAKAMEDGLTTYAITLTVTGTDALGTDGTLTFTPDVNTGCGLTAAGTGKTWSSGT